MDVNRLEQIAQQLIARVRDDEPEANARWLAAHTTAEERGALLFILAAAVPDDRTWSQLIGWTRPPSVDTPVDMEKRRRMKRVA